MPVVFNINQKAMSQRKIKFLFIVQGEGRGHLTQAMTLEKLLVKNGHEVVGILVGKSKNRVLPDFFMKGVSAPVHQFFSINFLPSANNRKPNILKSVAYNLAVLRRYVPSLHLIRDTIAMSGADVVVNFYELLTGLSYALYNIKVPQVCIGHQYLFLHRDFNLPLYEYYGKESLRLFTRITAIGATKHLALSFRKMRNDGNIKVVPPLLRRELRDVVPTKGNYIHGYMLNSGFAEDVLKWHSEHPEVELRFFWDKWSEEPVKKIDDTLTFYLINDKEFLKQMAGCMAYASTAGFESVCEAMYLGKPVLMVPSHIEQELNAFDALKGNAGVVADKFDLSALLEFSERFVPDPDFVGWADSAEEIILDELESAAED